MVTECFAVAVRRVDAADVVAIAIVLAEGKLVALTDVSVLADMFVVPGGAAAVEVDGCTGIVGVD